MDPAHSAPGPPGFTRGGSGPQLGSVYGGRIPASPSVDLFGRSYREPGDVAPAPPAGDDGADSPAETPFLLSFGSALDLLSLPEVEGDYERILPWRQLSGPPDVQDWLDEDVPPLGGAGPTDSDLAWANPGDFHEPDFRAHAAPASPPPDLGPFSKAAAAGHRPYSSKGASRGRPLPLSVRDADIVDTMVRAMGEAGIVEEAPRSAFISYPFLVPKADGTSRLIVDYSHLTAALNPVKLSLPPLATVLRTVKARRNWVATRIDLSHAFYSVALHPKARHITNFKTRSGLYRFTRLPMGLATSPGILRGILQEHLQPVRKQWPQLLTWFHVDDFLVAGPPRDVRRATNLLLAVLTQSGFVVNHGKSQLEPCPVIDYLGLTLNFPAHCFGPTRAHQEKLLTLPAGQIDELRGRKRLRYLGYLAFFISVTMRQYADITRRPSQLLLALRQVYPYTKWRTEFHLWQMHWQMFDR